MEPARSSGIERPSGPVGLLPPSCVSTALESTQRLGTASLGQNSYKLPQPNFSRPVQPVRGSFQSRSPHQALALVPLDIQSLLVNEQRGIKLLRMSRSGNPAVSPRMLWQRNSFGLIYFPRVSLAREEAEDAIPVNVTPCRSNSSDRGLGTACRSEQVGTTLPIPAPHFICMHSLAPFEGRGIFLRYETQPINEVARRTLQNIAKLPRSGGFVGRFEIHSAQRLEYQNMRPGSLISWHEWFDVHLVSASLKSKSRGHKWRPLDLPGTQAVYL